jgi:uncharacterized protein
MTRSYRFHDGKTGAAVTVHVTPRAKRSEMVEISPEGTLRIRLTAPPVEGKANKELIKLLAQILDIPQSRIEIVAGETGRDKLVAIHDLSMQEVEVRIHDWLSIKHP